MTDPDTPHSNPRPAPAALDSVQITLDLYRSGKSGISYDVLRRFSRPILSHYELDLQHAFDQDVSPHNVEDVMLLLDVFEIAHAFWDYCSLSESRKAHAFDPLRTNLLGPAPSTEDALQFPILLAAMEEVWETLSASEDSKPSTPVFFDDGCLPDLGAPGRPATNGAMLYGPDQLELPEAFALFARPLLENDQLFENPDALDDAMVRAQAYWDIAHDAAECIEKEIDRVAHRFANPDEPDQTIRTEALRMIERFKELFPERK